MDNGTLLLITFFITIILGLVIQIGLYKHRKKQKAVYPILWKQFEWSLKKSTDQEIIDLGNKIIYNKFVPTKHLEEIQRLAQELELKNPEFQKLRLNAYDKWIHHTKGRGYGY